MEPAPFRWNLARRAELGRLVEGVRAASYPEMLDDLAECAARVVATAGATTMVFVGRSPESLFDYLSDRSFVTMMNALWDAVVPGGRLLIGNVSVKNPTRYFMEYVAEWFLIHRTEAQLLEKARALRPAPRSVRVDAEPLGVNLFLVVEK